MPPVLQRRISHFRDYQITHEYVRVGLRGTVYGRGEEPRIAMAPAHPLARNSSDGSARSEDIEVLMHLMDQYIDLVTKMFATNRAKARFNARSKRSTKVRLGGET